MQVGLSVGPISLGIWSQSPQLRDRRERTLPLCVVGGWTLGVLCCRGSPTPPEQGGLQQELLPGSPAACTPAAQHHVPLWSASFILSRSVRECQRARGAGLKPHPRRQDHRLGIWSVEAPIPGTLEGGESGSWSRRSQMLLTKSQKGPRHHLTCLLCY